jgi:hypothetical protein
LKIPKKSGAKVGKKGVSYATDSLPVVTRSEHDRPEYKFPGIFSGSKVENPKKIPVES